MKGNAVVNVQELCEKLKNEVVWDETITKEIVDLEMEEEMLIQVLKDTVETSWGRDTLESKIVHEWLSNFQGNVFSREYERKLALLLAIHMVYYNESDICYLVKIAYRKLIHEIVVKDDVSVEEAIRSIIFYPLGSISESGPFLSYYFRKENNLSTDFFVGSENSILSSTSIKNIVFLDDVSISGGQLGRFLKKIRKETIWTKLFEEKNFYALFLISTVKAKKCLKNDKIHLIAPILMDERSQCFKTESTIYKIFDKNIRDTIRLQSKHMTQVYGYNLLVRQYSLNGELQRLLDSGKNVEEIMKKIKKDALGYDDSEALIAFEYNTPNNCLPIIWVENEEWKPLFKRNDKLYTSKVIGGIKNDTIYI